MRPGYPHRGAPSTDRPADLPRHRARGDRGEVDDTVSNSIRAGGSRRTRRARWALPVLGCLLLLAPAVAALPADHGGPPPPPVSLVGFGWPVDPPHPVVHPFRPPTTRYGPGHRGVDLGAPAGTPVRAAADAIVVYAGPLAGRGVISLQHPGGLRTTYEPVAAMVHRGQHVTRGAVIGLVRQGHHGCRSACLHWGAHRGGQYLDPLTLLATGGVRLLPWHAPGRGRS